MLGERLSAVWALAIPSLSLTAGALFMLALAETSRVPVDDPGTHLELTMIHEVIVLDHSGPDLALVLFGSAAKLALFGALVVSVLVPRGLLVPWRGSAGRCWRGWCSSPSRSAWSRPAWRGFG